MGLFRDDQYDPNTYAPTDPNAGLLERLSAIVGAAPDAGPGFPSSPMDAQASAPAAAPAQPQNAPIAVGNVMMPRIGSGFDLPPGQLDPATGEHVAPAPAAAPMQQPMQPAAMPSLLQPAAPAAPSNPLSSFFNKAADGLQSISRGGHVLNAIRGQYDDPKSVQQQQTQQLATALGGAGLSQQLAAQLATIHAIDKEAGKALIEKALGPPQAAPQYAWDPKTGKAVHLYEPEQKDNFQVVQTGEDGLGKKTFSRMNKADGTMTPIGAAPGADTGGGLGDTSLTGKDYLATIPPQQAGIVKAMVEGRQAPPSSFALGKPYWQNMIAAAQNVDPTFDQTSWPARVAGMKSFRSGADAGTVRSANQVLGHISDLTDLAGELHNSDYPAWNYVKNTWNSQAGADASNNWVTQAHAVADELSSFMKGAGHSSDTEIQQWKESLSSNMSPQQQRGAIKTLMGIYDHALSALEDKRTGAIGSVAAEKMGPLVTTAGKSAMDKVRKWAAGSAPGAPAVDRGAVEAEMKRRGLL
jgi:hypothetical protein